MKKRQVSNPVNVLIMCLADPSGNPRPKRVIDLCCKLGYSVSVVSYAIKKPIKIDRHFLIPEINKKPPLKKLLNKLRNLNIIIWRFLLRKQKSRDCINDFKFRLLDLPTHLESSSFDLVIVEDLQLLPLAHRIKGSAKIIFDAREYYPRQNEDSILFRILERPERIRLCKEYLHRCDGLVTVSDGLAKEYEREFKVKMHVVRSAPNKIELSVKSVGAGSIKMVHHGAANKNRKLENMIAVMERLDDRFSLDFYLTGDQEYIDRIKRIAKSDARIRILDPIPFSSITPVLNMYDIGFYLLAPTGFNTTYCLPNKLFEFIQARLMVAIGPSPDMASLVRKYDCGVISPSFDIEDMVNCLNRLTPDLIQNLKRNSDIAARELCFEVEGMKLEKIITELVGSRTIGSSGS